MRVSVSLSLARVGLEQRQEHAFEAFEYASMRGGAQRRQYRRRMRNPASLVDDRTHMRVVLPRPLSPTTIRVKWPPRFATVVRRVRERSASAQGLGETSARGPTDLVPLIRQVADTCKREGRKGTEAEVGAAEEGGGETEMERSARVTRVEAGGHVRTNGVHDVELEQV